MKKVAILLIGCILSTVLQAQKKPKIKGNGILSEISKEIYENFNAIEINDDLEVEFTQSGANTYTLKTDENLLDIVQFSVRDSILKIYTTNRITSSKKLAIELNAKVVEHIILKDDAKIKGTNRITSNKIYLSAYNSSNFKLDLNSDDVVITMHRNAGGKVDLKGKNISILMNDRTDLKGSVSARKLRITQNKSSELKLEGEADYAAYNLKDSAKLEAKKLKASSVDLYTSNTADVYVHATKNLEIYAQGKSQIYVFGDPKLEIKGLTDKSRVIKK